MRHHSTPIPAPRPKLLLNGVPLLVSLFALLGIWGCGELTQIEDYTRPKGSDKPPEPTEQTADTAKVPTRLVAAMVPQGQNTWFFKVMGPAEVVKPQIENFVRLISSVHFSDDNSPAWKLPDGWTQADTKRPGRFATLNLPTELPLELAVSSLTTRGDDYDEYTLININRWRNQVHLSAIGKEQLADEITDVPTEDGKALVVDLSGWTSGGNNPMKPPFAGHPPMAGGQARPPVAPRKRPSVQIPAFDLPKEWTEIPTVPKPFSSVVKTYRLANEGDKAEVTLSRMGVLPSVDQNVSINLANINRWRGQVGLKPIGAAEVKDAYAKIQAGKQTGRYLKLDGSETSMLVAMLDRSGSTWYIKLLGDAPLVTAQEAAFKKFVQSVRFSPNEEAGDE